MSDDERRHAVEGYLPPDEVLKYANRPCATPMCSGSSGPELVWWNGERWWAVNCPCGDSGGLLEPLIVNPTALDDDGTPLCEHIEWEIWAPPLEPFTPATFDQLVGLPSTIDVNGRQVAVTLIRAAEVRPDRATLLLRIDDHEAWEGRTPKDLT